MYEHGSCPNYAVRVCTNNLWLDLAYTDDYDRAVLDARLALYEGFDAVCVLATAYDTVAYFNHSKSGHD